MIKRCGLRHTDIARGPAQAELPGSSALDQRQRAGHHGGAQIAVVIRPDARTGGRVIGGERRGRIDHVPREPSAVQPFYFSVRPIGIVLVTPLNLALVVRRQRRIGGAGPGLLFPPQQIFPQRRCGTFGARQSAGFMRGQFGPGFGLWWRRTAVWIVHSRISREPDLRGQVSYLSISTCTRPGGRLGSAPPHGLAAVAQW